MEDLVYLGDSGNPFFNMPIVGLLLFAVDGLEDILLLLDCGGVIVIVVGVGEDDLTEELILMGLGVEVGETGECFFFFSCFGERLWLILLPLLLLL